MPKKQQRTKNEQRTNKGKIMCDGAFDMPINDFYNFRTCTGICTDQTLDINICNETTEKECLKVLSRGGKY